MPEPTASADPSAVPPCPRCQGAMWDNREGKRNPKAPDFKCRDKSCDGVIWPPRGAAPAAAQPAAPAGGPSPAPVLPVPEGMPACPICGGAMWDDRTSKRNPKAPDFKCRNKPRERGGPGCEGVIWPARDGSPSPYPASAPRRTTPAMGPPDGDAPPLEEPPFLDEAPPYTDDDLPF